MSPDAAAELVERPPEPVLFFGDERQEAVPFGLELVDLLLEILRVSAGRLGLARALRCEIRKRLPVLLEL